MSKKKTMEDLVDELYKSGKEKKKEVLVSSVDDFFSLSLDDLREYCLVRLKWLFLALKKETTLCSNIGEEIVAEFGFRGTLEEVKTQLWEYRERIKTQGLTDADRGNLYQHFMNLGTYKAEERKDPNMAEYYVHAKTNIEMAMKALDRHSAVKKKMHDIKECLCYTNRV